jgi:TPP-dependent pyruvate/acetoin dehydrogenase alpha subunit
MPGTVVDGQDVVDVWQAAKFSVGRARRGQGPSFIECKTYRYYGHHQGDDPLRYRTVEEEKAARSRDCIKRFREQAVARDLIRPEELEAIDAENRRVIDEAVAFAEASPLPDLKDLYTDVYVPSRQGDSVV